MERNGREITLTPREFGLLEFLMRNAGRVVGKTEILDSVWDPHYEGDVNIVELQGTVGSARSMRASTVRKPSELLEEIRLVWRHGRRTR